MSDKARSAYEAWNQADVQARQAEARLGVAWQAYFDGKGRPPDDALIHEVSRLRAVANDRLSVAMATINSQRGREHPG
jgi:hypothetical protein